MFKVLRDFRGILEALRGLEVGLAKVTAALVVGSPFEERLLELERSREMFEAKMAAEILKAEAHYRSASNAEARERTMQKSYEEDPLAVGDPDREEVPQGVHVLDVGSGEDEPLQPVHMGLEAMAAADPKALAMMMKYS